MLCFILIKTPARKGRSTFWNAENFSIRCRPNSYEDVVTLRNINNNNSCRKIPNGWSCRVRISRTNNVRILHEFGIDDLICLWHKRPREHVSSGNRDYKDAVKNVVFITFKRRQTSEYDVSKVDHRCLSIDKNETQLLPLMLMSVELYQEDFY